MIPATKTFYDKTAPLYDERHDNATTRWMRKKEIRIVKRHAKGRVLDIGCGTGPRFSYLKDVIGLDISQGMLEKAREKTNSLLIQGSAENLPFPDGSFDTVLCLFSVLNFCDFNQAVKEMNRVLKNKGKAIVSVTSVWDRREGNFFQRLKDVAPMEKSMRIEKVRVNMHLFSRKEFSDLFRKNGFGPGEFHGSFKWQKPYWGWFRDFTIIERIKLSFDKMPPYRTSRIYFGVFKKIKDV